MITRSHRTVRVGARRPLSVLMYTLNTHTPLNNLMNCHLWREITYKSLRNQMMAGGRVRQQFLVFLRSFCPAVAGVKFVIPILYRVTITRGIYEVDSCDEGKAISSLLLALFFPQGLSLYFVLIFSHLWWLGSCVGFLGWWGVGACGVRPSRFFWGWGSSYKYFRIILGMNMVPSALT